MPRVLIALGSNLGNRAATLDRALAVLAQPPDTRIVARSAWHETAAIGGPAQGTFLNGAAVIETSVSPEAFLGRLHEVEQSLGRTRKEQWGPRTIDLDLLLYDDLVLDSPRLVVPHLRMAFRRFVVEPAAEIAGGWVHPTIGWTLDHLLAHLRDAVDYVAVTAVDPQTATSLVETVSKAIDVRPILRPPASSILSLDAAIESLAIVQSRLDREHWIEPGRPAISDFWFDEICAWCRSRLKTAEDLVTFDAACRHASQRVMLPKLLVLVSNIERVDTRSFQGPVLRLSDPSLDTQCREVTAAIEAMRRR